MPTTFFFRMAYAEAMFLLLIALVLYGITRQWPVLIVALVVGLATATRPVGVALLLPFGLYVWRNTLAKGDRVWGCFRAAPLLVVACWGLIAFMTFQWLALGDPLLFAKSQVNCRLTLAEEISMPHRVLALITLEPIWALYVPSRPEYWANYDQHRNLLCSLQFANPIYFVGTVVLVMIGWRKKWLNEYELLLSAALLLIPYVTKSYDNGMASFGRFSAVVLPAYIVMGHLLHRMGPALAAIVLALMAVMLFIYSAMFAAGYRMI